MEIIKNPPHGQWPLLCERNQASDPQVEEAVTRIIADVRARGDEALREYAAKFDGAKLTDIEVAQEEIDAAAAKVDPEVRLAIEAAIRNVRRFHQEQIPRRVDVEVMPGVRCVQKAVPIRRVGLYIPGGRAPLFSTVIMLAVPAELAGCSDVILCTPSRAPEILFTASRCGIRHIYAVGGAQAIAAMAYGTASIGRRDKIFGPGNRYVTCAKQLVSRDVAIDMPAGPSEVLVMADDTADARFVAADLLSQAEHGPDSQAILVTNSERMAEKVSKQVDELKRQLNRVESVEGSLSHSRIVVFDYPDSMIEFVNTYAPEHLIISMKEPWKIAERTTNAGSVFIGNYSPESAGDYASGTNHTLPTGGWAASMSGVNIDSFMHKVTYQDLTQQGIRALSKTITAMARAEGLDAHALAVKVRTDEPA